MLRTFNCGIGMVLVVDPARSTRSPPLLERGETVYRMGEIAPGDRPARVEIRPAWTAAWSARRTAVLISGRGSNLLAL